ncbi:GNAT family N-acetyltransferase [Sphingopyxis indica]|uniref:GNAT family N-acetyltransferase n=1 Tax=Sphingopyxis indica TaxID=436663 RepID=UPI0037430822
MFANTGPGNAGSIALLERLGFRREGRLRGEWPTHVGVRDSPIFGMLQGERPA